MHLLSSNPEARSRTRRGCVAVLALAGMTVGQDVSAATPCPWVVQPYPEPVAATPDQKPTAPAFQIVFDGMPDEGAAFYGFSVASMDLAAQFADLSRLPDLSTDARPLEAARTELGTVAYRVTADTIEPHVVYLVSAPAPVEPLEQIAARIEPDRPIAVSALALRTRGASDLSGPLPHRSVPGFLVASADDDSGPNLKICAYQVAMR